MEDIKIRVSKETRKITYISNSKIGNDGENLQGNIIFLFEDTFVNGQARIETIINGIKTYQILSKEEETYKIPIKSVLTKYGQLKLQLVVTEGISEEEIPIFKSDTFVLNVDESVNAIIEQPEEYPTWIEIANTKLNQMDNLDIDMSKEDKTTTVTLTKKDGTEETVEISDGKDGTTNFATFEINNDMELIMYTTEDMNLEFNLDDNGNLSVLI